MEHYDNRESVPEKYKWDLTSFFKDENEFNKVFKDTSEKIKKLSSYVGCTKSDELTKEFLDLYVEVLADWEDLYVYSHLINDEVVGISKNIERKSSCESLLDEFNHNVNFFDPELLKLSEDEAKKLINSDLLKDYKFYLENIYRNKEHILSEDEEKILNEFNSFSSTYQDMAATLLYGEHDYGEVKMEDGTIKVLAPNNLASIMKKLPRDRRKSVREKFYSVVDKYSKSNALYLNEYVRMNERLALLRKHNSTWDEYLFNTNISNKVFEKLISACEKRVDVIKKYYDVRRKGLKLDELHFYDLPLDICNNDLEYSIEDGIKIIKEALKPLGDEYLSRFNKIIDNRYIDFCSYKGKYIGGYSFSTYKQDSRILLSYNGDMDSISTIIHESGHNIHQQYVSENNHLIYHAVDAIVGEVPSLTNEVLLSMYLINNGDKTEQISGFENLLLVSFSNLFDAVREGKMELDMYNYVRDGGMLTKEYMDNLAEESMKKYYGGAIVFDDCVKNSWVNRTHYFNSFYLFSYAICMCVALYSCKKILDGDLEYLNKYKEFLKLGADNWQVDAFKVLGFDLEDEKIYLDSIDYLEELVLKFDAILSS